MEQKEILPQKPALSGRPAAPWDAESLRPALWELLGRRVRRYTMADSSSVPAETAGELLESILYSIGLAVSAGAPPPEPGNLDALLEFSWGVIEERLGEAKELLKRAKASLPPASAMAQESTLEEMDAFFQRYDYRFFAHQIPCSVDYPLCLPVPENLGGVEYIREYLRRLALENAFCLRLEEYAVTRLALFHCRGDLSMPVNLYSITVPNALACNILGEPIRFLDISPAGQILLLNQFKSASPEEVREELNSSALALYRELGLSGPEEREYLEIAAGNLVHRIIAAAKSGDLAGVFPSLPDKPDVVFSAPMFADNETMDDGTLRDLAETLSDCSSVSEKVDLVLRNVHSLRDLVEILNLCFWEDEPDEMLRSLDGDTLFLLRAYVLKKGPDWHSETGWETRLPKIAPPQSRNMPHRKD
ncbi:DUF6179 domain-containing protein [Papillibacter cinnamivorans]|uniref:Uncharacterized protein n=1 Tax=Papillibacter cinnamivorans DSM 12816 TaxID=1122930 RepID=A0A1W2CKL4_9FIRM|nr:DUF6179 domain-containing protein [Papillibacter cinnamivorans]SMC85769.1 hypothetical protein SAMN02745168_0074 [Papillibacter cinnamivorans DSM 12816]